MSLGEGPRTRGRTAQRVSLFTESVIREMTRVATLHGAINLAQGFPDFDPPAELLEAAVAALREGYNQYAITWGSPRLRAAIAEKFAWYNSVEVDPDRHVTVTCGATEAMMAALLAVVDPGDEVVVFEPFYENYGPDALLSGAVPRYVRLDLDRPGIPFDPDELRAAVTRRTRAIIVNTPHNPSGKVFTRPELELIADLCRTVDAFAITDEVYEHLLYDGAAHCSLAALPGMAERTITVNSLSKTYSVTGWRVGWCIVRDAAVTDGIRRAHDFLTVGAAAPLQEAGAVALRFPRSYYAELAAAYQARRDRLVAILRQAGFRPVVPQGAYYVMADFTALGGEDDVAFAHRLAAEGGVATVPGSSFFHDPALGRRYVRFAFPKRAETLEAVATRLGQVRERVGG
ncbi:MAG: aminotransferase class I/II-fold pyridoxal phosphate-dependent enzyme [Armatimonadota bacterium]|nr:aminotransferase class I/II-fold pyridoxal phosphate-dependent enzyme [Armatimonadota bacterium]MDR7447585.1 aminotransferase class I/II-fold pyridoxal phosphate-dependent enzyme [Armatimonadota bacterium]MDR7458752.1 aminotransferase class I/II-fold pyridoxal phosphate-dependent enzyme [Armatimonadota bacterium]MDR7480512.1 aminotransferase class I/II-fold pyridoxal phosphate-dependent enzyme [Armatimonadota bacterium]MDR7489341.1 aminotransferase class I/II-fold pyridoxal phosphate-depende